MHVNAISLLQACNKIHGAAVGHFFGYQTHLHLVQLCCRFSRAYATETAYTAASISKVAASPCTSHLVTHVHRVLAAYAVHQPPSSSRQRTP
jgi:hypothetical protein